MDAKKKGLVIMYHEIHRLRHVEGFSIQRIADHLSINFRTVKKYLDMNEEAFDQHVDSKWDKPQLLDPFREFIVSYLKKYQDTPSAVMHDRLKEHYPLFPKVDPKTVYNYVMGIRKELNLPRIPAADRQYSPVPDLSPGQQAQVDFGEKKLRTSTGIWIKVYFFIMVLCYSRRKYVFFAESPFTAESAVDAHERAFSYFQGMTREIVYDQASVFLHRENGGDYILTDVFDRYCACRLFKTVFCRPGDPESKGKVENTVKFVKQNFLFQRTFVSIDILNEQVLSWLDRTGNAMVHNTTRKIPDEQWSQERHQLQKWTPLFPLTKVVGYKVLKTNTVKYHGNSYSLPFGTYSNDNTLVYLSENAEELTIRNAEGTTLAVHQIPVGVGNNVVNTNHRRDTSVKLDILREQVRTAFSHSPDIITFLNHIDRLYPRYVRDQLSTIVSIIERFGAAQAEVALEFCVRNRSYSANDLKYILESKAKSDEPQGKAVHIKPLGDAKARLLAQIKPVKSDIRAYESIFNPTSTTHEPVHPNN